MQPGRLSPREIVIGKGLTRISYEIYRRADLTVLDYQNNCISRVEPSVKALGALEELNLAGNQLTSIPKEVGELRNLRILNLSNNTLTSIPGELARLRKLEVLNLAGNRLTELPREFADLPPSVILNVTGNPLIEPWAEIAGRGTAELLKYLKTLREARPIYEAKLLVVGEGNVGKTSLLAALRQEPFIEGRETTHGIETNTLTVPHPKLRDKVILLQTWDFGGQEVYRISHQFFFSRRAIFLVVWRPREGREENAVAEWCERIRLRAGSEARIILVATHGNERRAELDWPSLKDEFGKMLMGRVMVDSRTRLGLKDLLRLVATAASDLPHMGELVSPAWIRARKRILRLHEPEVSFERFAEICRDDDLDDDEARLLATFMHDVGHIIHFAQDGGLRDVVVLQPDWLTRAIGRVLEDQDTSKSGGILRHSRLPKLWGSGGDAVRYDPRYFPYFLRLMEKFDVSYRIPDVDASLVSQLVPFERPALPWRGDSKVRSGRRELGLRIKMNRQPPGLMAWITVRNHHYSTGKHWRGGVFLAHEQYGSEALVELRSTELSILVRAPSPDLFLHQILGTVEALIKQRWPGLQYRLLVSCPGYRDGCSGTFPLVSLSQMRERGITTTHCHVCVEVVDVTQLLTGFKSSEPSMISVVDEIRASELRVVEAFRLGTENIAEEVHAGQALAADVALGIRSILRALSYEVNDCPRLFKLEEARGRLSGLRLHRRYHLTLWCEQPGKEHESTAPPYEFQASKEWLQKISPYVKLISDIVKTLIPVGAGIWNLMSDSFEKSKSNEITKLAEPLVGEIAELASRHSLGSPSSLGTGILNRPEAEGLRLFRRKLFDLDPQRRFSGLRRVLTPSGDYLYVCPSHYLTYDPGLPSLPTSGSGNVSFEE